MGVPTSLKHHIHRVYLGLSRTAVIGAPRRRLVQAHSAHPPPYRLSSRSERHILAQAQIAGARYVWMRHHFPRDLFYKVTGPGHQIDRGGSARRRSRTRPAPGCRPTPRFPPPDQSQEGCRPHYPAHFLRSLPLTFLVRSLRVLAARA